MPAPTNSQVHNPSLPNPLVTVRGLRKNFGSKVAVDGLDLVIPRGAVFGLLGPNGAGKTTTFGLLCGWLPSSGGDIKIMGVPPTGLQALRGRVSVLPQDALFPPQVTVASELDHFARLCGLSRRQARAESLRCLAAVGLAESADLKGPQLSHGMLKRVALAQALIGSPDLIMLDEPTAGLDPKSSRLVKDIISGLAPAATVVVASHNLADVQEICTHGAILDKGRVVAAGTIDDLTRRGQEISIETANPAAIPLLRLHEAFGPKNVDVQEAWIKIRFSTGEHTSAAIARALTLLLEEKVPLLRVHPGTTLEQTFLEVTSSDETTVDPPRPEDAMKV